MIELTEKAVKHIIFLGRYFDRKCMYLVVMIQ